MRTFTYEIPSSIREATSDCRSLCERRRRLASVHKDLPLCDLCKELGMARTTL